jgi:subtilisin family serine protease
MVSPVRRLTVPLCLSCLGLALGAPGAPGADDLPAPPLVTPTPATALSSRDVIVQWTPGADRGDRAEARAGAEVLSRGELDNPAFQLVRTLPGQTPGEAVRQLEADPAVAVAERDSYSVPTAIPDDPLFGELWGLRNDGLGVGGFASAIAGDDIDVDGAWLRTVGDPAVIVADIDSGYRFEHPDLAGVAWSNPGELANGIDDDGNGIVDDLHGADFVGPNSEVTPVIDGDPTDDDLLSGGHGVHTAGTIGARGDNGIGITGVAQDIRIMPLRACARYPSTKDSRCPVSSQINAINYAGDHGARVANMSLSATSFSQAQVNAIAANPQVLFVVAAGNDGVDGDLEPRYPCAYRPHEDALPPQPGAIDNLVCVAATNQADGLAGFSNWGAESVDLGAPGTETLSTYPYVTPLAESFADDDFATAWPPSGASGGFERTAEAPLTSFGMTDRIGPPLAGSVRETTSPPSALPANGGCKLTQTRRVVMAGSEHFRYSVLLDGVPAASAEPAPTPGAGLERRFIELPPEFEAGGTVQLRFRFSAGATPEPESGIWLDDISLVCVEAVGQASGYGFLQGTSMAAPHVSGTAALLFSSRPAATVAEVREALLANVDPVASLTGNTVTGGRLDAARALDAFDTVAPVAPLLTGTDPASPAPEAHPRILGSADERSTVRVYRGFGCGGAPVAEGTAAQLSAPGIAVEVPPDSFRQFSATATDSAANTSPCSEPIAYANSATVPVLTGPYQPGTVTMPPPEAGTSAPPPSPGSDALSCTVPKLAGKTLARARSALAASGCKLGKVIRPRARRGLEQTALVVRSSTPRAGTAAAGAVVAVTLGPKPKRRRH